MIKYYQIVGLAGWVIVIVAGFFPNSTAIYLTKGLGYGLGLGSNIFWLLQNRQNSKNETSTK